MKRKPERQRRTGRKSAPQPRPRTALVLMAGLPALLAFGVFANTMANGFVYDDVWKIRQLSGPAPSFGYLVVQNRGFTHAVHYLDKALWGDRPAGFHLTNVVLHSLASALVAVLAFHLSRSRRVGLLCGLLFAVHPVHVEAVASFVNRKDVLAMIFVALALLAWRGARWQVLRYFLALAFFGLALSAKEVAAAGLAGMLLLADLLPLPGSSGSWRSRFRRASLRSLPFVLAATIFVIVYAQDLAEAFSPAAVFRISEMRLHTYGQVLANVAASVPENLRLLFFPLRLCADYASSPEVRLTSPKALLGLALLSAWIPATIFLGRHHPLFSFALAWPLVMYAPCSNLFPGTHFFVAERYLYVPSFGICLLLALATERGLRFAEERGRVRRSVVVLALVVLVITAGAARCALRNRDWRAARPLWESALRAGCETSRVHHNLGDALARESRGEEAIPYLVKALHGGPLALKSRTQLVLLLMGVGAYEEVEKECRRILGEFPQAWGCHAYLGKISILHGDPGQAVRHYREVLKAQPEHEEVLKQLTWLYATGAERRDLTEALEIAERAREVTGGADPEVLFHLAVLHAEAGNVEVAVRWARDAFSRARSDRRVDLARRIQPLLRRLAHAEYYRLRHPEP